ncbi:bifunctional diguanylate cyclase/phosphodiesterase [Pseudomonas sp.]|uniref:putative bifunctional diguanylate cyclase/phosphodiesterase n=1 Tax=Pseudomonas sp. TaxID=306 RepID=UPI0027332FE0|nr:bifunctional diguanylate cyclase/phosphodiesterase [Pseudomonas sp.]MDP3813779.1 bifunctional diguanylate cyclase/phosphodiesterase [Pseudomonas sp.]
MDWLGLHFIADLPADGQIILQCSYNPLLVLLAYVVASAASFTALNLAERVGHAERRGARLMWRWVGAFCLAGGIWSMHFVAMLAFQAPVPIHYDILTTAASLLTAFIAALLAMYTLGHEHLRLSRYLLAAFCIGLGIAAMHYSGMAAIRSPAIQYYQPWLFALSILIAFAASLVALLLALYFRNSDGFFHQMLKYLASLVMGAAIVSMHFTGMWSLSLVVPLGTPLQLQPAENSLQLGLTIGLIALLIIGSGLSAAWADRKLESKERDLLRVNTLLNQLDHARASLQQAAHYDALTNLLNRRGFNQLFAEQLQEHIQRNQALAVMFLDIDHFKRINDSLGHDAGDEMLKVVAERLRGTVREHDVIARLGGDEFCILASLHSDDEARQLAQRVMEKMKDPIALFGRSLVMTASIGISLLPEDGQTCEELLKHADLALYQSKGCGRNTLYFFSSHLKAKVSLELQLEEELHEALREEHGLQLYYQPILDLRSGQPSKLEALVRWQHPQHGLLTPERFIGIAEANGFIAELDAWVLRRACHDLKLLGELGFAEMKVAVNCSALNLGRDELVQEVRDALQSTGVQPQRLELEVTENALMGNINRAAELLQQIRNLGVSLSIDDFGTGYSSLAYLRRLPLDTLKIDRSFVQDIPESQQGMDIVQAIIGMAHTLKLKVVAEGVETSQQLEFLREHGCDFIQGYLLSRPLPLQALQDLLYSFDTAPQSAWPARVSLT